MAGRAQIPSLDLSVDFIGGKETARNLEKRAALLGTKVGHEIRREAGLFGKELALVFPPFGAFGAIGETFAQQRRRGLGKTEGDIAKVISSPSHYAGRIKRANPEKGAAAAAGFRRAMRQGNHGEARGILRRFGVDQPAQIGNDPASFHASRRRRGRVTGGRIQTKYMVESHDAYKAFVAGKLKRVMTLKRGWLPAMRYFGSKGMTAALVGDGRQSGTLVDNTRAKKNPSATLQNSTPYADPHYRYVIVAERNRGKKLEKQLEILKRKAWNGRL